MVRQLVGPPIQFPVAQLPPLEDERRRRGRSFASFRKKLMDAQLPDLAPRVVPLFQELTAAADPVASEVASAVPRSIPRAPRKLCDTSLR